ncbi:hypothetical protein BDL97_18G104500 [Sphagnum fallax]|nr:hypothetical protein BDL97_18G104500 [Sphagnum fallax]
MQIDHNLEVQQRQQAALDFVVPKYTPPFPYKLNPKVEEANKAALIWFAHHFGSSMSHDNFQNICLENPHYLAGAIYPEAPISRLEFAIEFVIWLFVVDDESLLQRSTLDELVQFQQEIQGVIMSTFPQDKSLQDNLQKCLNDERAQVLNKDFFENVLAQVTTKPLLETDSDDHRSLSPVASSFRDLWIRATSRMSKEWTLRFAKILQRDVFANFLESQNLRHDINPSLSSYIPERRKSGLMESYIVLIEFLQDVSLPNTIYYSAPMQRLREATVDAVCWNNDIWSFPKELVAGEVANLVFLISKEEGCSYNKAAEIVTQMLVDKCKEMQLAALELKEYCKIHEATTTQMVAIDHYISCCNHWVSGSHVFHSQSARFQVVQT